MIGSLWFNSFSAGGGGAAGDYELISTTVLGSTTASVALSITAGQQATYKHLQIRAAVRTNRAGQTSDPMIIKLNSDSGANYEYHELTGNGSSVTSGAGGASSSSMWLGYVAASNQTTNAFSGVVMDIPDAFSTSKNKTLKVLQGMAGSDNQIQLTSGLWMSTAAISTITFTALGSYITGSRFSLYGLRG